MPEASQKLAVQEFLHPGDNLTSSSFKASLLHLKAQHMLEMGICKGASSAFVSKLIEGLSNFQVKALFVPVPLCSMTNLKKKKYSGEKIRIIQSNRTLDLDTEHLVDS